MTLSGVCLSPLVSLKQRRKKVGAWWRSCGRSGLSGVGHQRPDAVSGMAGARSAATYAALMWALDDELKRAQIEVLYPQSDLHMCFGTPNVRIDKS